MSLLATTMVLAAEGDGGGSLELLPDQAELIWGIVAFAVLFAFMAKFAFPRINALLDERAARIQGQIEEAESQRNQAEQLRRQYESQLADARNQANQIVEDARGQAEQVRSDIVSRAEEEASQITARARADAEAERGRLVQDLRTQVASLSVELAGKIVQKELDPSQHQELVDQYINELSGLN